MLSVLSPRRRTDNMKNHDSTQLTGATNRVRSAASKLVPSHPAPSKLHCASRRLGASLPRWSATPPTVPATAPATPTTPTTTTTTAPATATATAPPTAPATATATVD